MRQDAVIVLICGFLLLIIVPVTHWFGRTLQRLILLITGSLTASLYTYHALLLPGTLLHEVSHLAVAWLLRVPTGKLSLRPQVVPAVGRGRKTNMAQFGAVEIASTDPLRESLIGLAPLLSGTAVVLWIARGFLGLAPATLSWDAVSLAWSGIIGGRDPALWLYLLVAVSNAMLPSASDRRAWHIVALYFAVGLALLYVTGVLSHMPAQAIGWMAGAVQGLAFVFLLTIVVDIALGLVFWLLSFGLGWLLGRQLQYS